jgi:hypothetical protein
VIPPDRNAEFVANMEKVLDVYRARYSDTRVLICMDEASKQLIKETRSSIAAAPGRACREDYEYELRGTCNVFMANEPLKGKRFVKVTDRRTKVDWAHFIDELSQEYSHVRKIVLVMDNLNTHNPSSLYEAFPAEKAKKLWDRFKFVYTPKHGSWLNMAEIELNVLMNQSLDRRIDNIDEVKEQVRHWQTHRNNLNATINWRFTTKKSRVKLKRLYPTFDK